MENWNPFGWLLLLVGFLLGVITGWMQVWSELWLVSYGVMLAGLRWSQKIGHEARVYSTG